MIFKKLRTRRQRKETEEIRKALEFFQILLDSPYSLKQIKSAAEELADIDGWTIAQELDRCADQVESGRAFDDTSLGVRLQMKHGRKG